MMLKSKLFGLIKIFQFLRDENVKFTKKLLFFVPLIYLILPFDIVGDFFPVAGQLDDIAVFVVMWPFLKKLLTDYDKGEQNSKRQTIKDDENTIDINKDEYKVE